MAITTFMTNNFWAQIKGHTTFAAFLTANPDAYPTEAALDNLRQGAFGIIYRYLATGASIDTDDTYYLQNLEYRMVELMIDEEMGRKSADMRRPDYLPRDYMFIRDRDYLQGIGQGEVGFAKGN